MEGLLQKNPGLRSRIAYHVPFNDYDTAALCEIAKLIAKQKGLTFTDEACNKLTGLFDAARNESNFGNGRYVRNLIEKAKMAQASRLLTMDFDSIESEDIALITADDIEIPKKFNKDFSSLDSILYASADYAIDRINELTVGTLKDKNVVDTGDKIITKLTGSNE